METDRDRRRLRRVSRRDSRGRQADTAEGAWSLMRAELVARLQPLANRLAVDLATLISDRVEAMVTGVEEAFSVALSAAADSLRGG